ncbi:ribosomal silencing factor RsfS [Thermoanaerobacter kivui]|uniref:Ribosomal silencing factor RsfS n=1 Tax=Thermoanaerobacter kivui TaxID=2325 RepID=A0A097AQN2_THEKI|nr:ribosome silencing factor [Thermoanaerobacter kivui]AIS52113.1 ribosomal silencing factor RsfS [Thermoanaerobacter kivui]
MVDVKDKVFKICNLLEDKKAFDIKVLYIGELTTIADYFIIATGSSDTHVKALTDEIEKKLCEEGIFVDHIEGYASGKWVLMDYGDVVVHIFQEEERAFYNLERLWADAKEIVLDNLV